MIYVTGDTHSTIDWAKLHPESWPEGQTLTRDDYLIICGDFGGVWNMGPKDHEVLAWYEAQPWTTLWVDGNHENHDLIDAFEVSERFGGRVQVVPGYPHVIHLMRGEVYELPVSPGETARCFVLGGAPSLDRRWRVEGVSWWAREFPSQEEYDNAVAQLEACDWQVDYVFTHEVPSRAALDIIGPELAQKLKGKSFSQVAEYLQWFDDHLDKERLKMWYAGHHHMDRMVMDEQHCVLFHQIVRLGERPQVLE